MENKERLIEIKTTDGRPIVNLLVSERQVSRQTSSAESSANDSTMTDAQKRYLFRLLAEQGMQPDQAHDRLKELFGVDNLQQVGKNEASRMIESLLEKSESK